VKSTLQRLFPLVIGFLVLAFAAQAGDIPYNNISATSTGSNSISSFGPLADSFNSGPVAFNLTSIAVLLAEVSDSTTGTITMELLSNSSGPAPGSVLDIIGSITSPHFSGEAVFIPSGTITLAADTTYWIELVASGTDTQWFYSRDISGPGVAGQFFANRNGVFPNTDAPYQMEVSGTAMTATPEPSSLLLFGTSLLGLAPFRRKLFGR
jgi:PEP-CTERM motif